MPTVREYEAAMERNAADTEAFVALRKAYRQAQKHDRLVTLYETRAQAIEDNAKAGELFYLAAELRHRPARRRARAPRPTWSTPSIATRRTSAPPPG